MPRHRMWAVPLTAAALFLAACGGGNGDKPSETGGGEGKPGGVFRLGIVEPTAIDPYNAQESEGIPSCAGRVDLARAWGLSGDRHQVAAGHCRVERLFSSRLVVKSTVSGQINGGTRR